MPSCNPYFSSRTCRNFFLEDDKEAEQEPLYIGETLRMQVIELLRLECIKEDFLDGYEGKDEAKNSLLQLRWLKEELDRILEEVEQHNFDRIEKMLCDCRQMIADSPVVEAKK